MNRTEYGREIKKRLIDKGMTQVELAKLIGTSSEYLSMMLRGKKSVRKYRRKIEEILDIK